VPASGMPGDTTAPTAPQNLSAAVQGSAQINLTWSASSDNVGVAGYDVYRNGAKIATTASTSYSVTGLTPSTTYSFFVMARDNANNVSPASNTVSATTASASSADNFGELIALLLLLRALGWQ
jgi:chitodextrinase